jgi:hypothetical protein
MAAKSTGFDGMVEGFEGDFLGSGPWMVPDPEDKSDEGVDDE